MKFEERVDCGPDARWSNFGRLWLYELWFWLALAHLADFSVA